MSLKEIQSYLRAAPENFGKRDSTGAVTELKRLKAAAVAASDQSLAKYLWCLETILEIQDNFIKTFFHFKSQEFFDGWCLLERIEVSLSSLHDHFYEQDNEFQIGLITAHVPRYQSLFPYVYFASPEYLQIEKICNICQKPISIRNPCGHRVGQIYNGEYCIRLVTKMEYVGMAMVKSPVQKYSVPFLHDPQTGKSKDQYNYSLVKFLNERLQSPFHDWTVTWTQARHPHSKFKFVGRNDPCPCKSGKKYKKCCLQEEGVIQPHCKFTFSVEPPAGLPNLEYSY
jgi:hypothetical protein